MKFALVRSSSHFYLAHIVFKNIFYYTVQKNIMKQGKGADQTAVRFLGGALIAAFNTNINSFIIIMPEQLLEYTQT